MNKQGRSLRFVLHPTGQALLNYDYVFEVGKEKEKHWKIHLKYTFKLAFFFSFK